MPVATLGKPAPIIAGTTQFTQAAITCCLRTPCSFCRGRPHQRQSPHQSQVPRSGAFAAHELGQICPIRFAPTTRIAFSVLETSAVQLLISNLQDQEVRTLVSGQMNSGHHTVNWHGRDNAGNIVPSGVFLSKLIVNGFEETRKMTLMESAAVPTGGIQNFIGRSGILTALLAFHRIDSLTARKAQAPRSNRILACRLTRRRGQKCAGVSNMTGLRQHPHATPIRSRPIHRPEPHPLENEAPARRLALPSKTAVDASAPTRRQNVHSSLSSLAAMQLAPARSLRA